MRGARTNPRDVRAMAFNVGKEPLLPPDVPEETLAALSSNASGTSPLPPTSTPSTGTDKLSPARRPTEAGNGNKSPVPVLFAHVANGSGTPSPANSADEGMQTERCKRKRSGECSPKQSRRKEMVSGTRDGKSVESINWVAKMCKEQTPKDRPHVVIQDGEIKDGFKDVLMLFTLFGWFPFAKKKNAETVLYVDAPNLEMHESIRLFLQILQRQYEEYEYEDIKDCDECDESVALVLEKRMFLVESFEDGGEWTAEILRCRDVIKRCVDEKWEAPQTDFHTAFRCLEWPHVSLLWDVPDAYALLETDVPQDGRDWDKESANKFKSVFFLLVNVEIDKDTTYGDVLCDFVSKQKKKASQDFKSSCLRRRLNLLYRCLWHICDSDVEAVKQLAQWYFVDKHNGKPMYEYQFGIKNNRGPVPDSVFQTFVDRLDARS